MYLLSSNEALVKGKQCLINLIDIIIALFNKILYNNVEFAWMRKQKQAEGEALISTVLFDNVSEVLHDRVNVKDIQPMTEHDYTVRGTTALLDAIGGAIHHIGNVH